MSEIDRVFARLGGSQSAPSEQQEVRRVPRRGGAGSRVVEVVRVPGTAATARQDQAQRRDSRVRAQTWDDGFPAKSAATPLPAPKPASDEPRGAVAHVMPMWAPSAAQPEAGQSASPTSDPVPTTAPARAGRGRRKAVSSMRQVADPFDPDDSGANCYRCGYLIEPARERRGLMTCAGCG